jgi:hypothetical protein
MDGMITLGGMERRSMTMLDIANARQPAEARSQSFFRYVTQVTYAGSASSYS